MHVFVGLSGGVDSAVAAHLLVAAGHRVTGIFARIWQPEFTACTMEADRLSAKRVAAQIGIPFQEVDLSEDYRTTVIQDLIDGYARGETPNPDILCNQHIKYGKLLEHVRARGGDYLATGHYARVEHRTMSSHLLRGVDTAKDQSYFLANITPDALRAAQFPIGHLRKPEVRAYAARVGLANAHRPDSQGLCFVGPVTMDTFLKQYIPVTPGAVLDEEGKVIGTHDGAPLYTIGQRHGFTVHTAAPNIGPQYVVATDVHANTITVAPTLTRAERKELPLHSVRWLEEPIAGEEIAFQVRYRQTPQRGIFDPARSLLNAQEAQVVAAGQSVVLYRKDQCLGSGVLAASVNNPK